MSNAGSPDTIFNFIHKACMHACLHVYASMLAFICKHACMYMRKFARWLFHDSSMFVEQKNEPKDFMRVCVCVCVRACIADYVLARAPPLKINRLQHECRRIGKTQVAIATATLCKGGEGYFSFLSLFIGT
jgi:hypothetical protein